MGRRYGYPITELHQALRFVRRITLRKGGVRIVVHKHLNGFFRHVNRAKRYPDTLNSITLTVHA